MIRSYGLLFVRSLVPHPCKPRGPRLTLPPRCLCQGEQRAGGVSRERGAGGAAAGCVLSGDRAGTQARGGREAQTRRSQVGYGLLITAHWIPA